MDLDDASLEVLPATPERWDDDCAVMTTTGDSGTCWCQWFHLRTTAWKASTPAQRKATLAEQVCGDDGDGVRTVRRPGDHADRARPPGVLAYVDGEPAGWCAVGPRCSYDRLGHSRKLRAAGLLGGPDRHRAPDGANSADSPDMPDSRDSPDDGVWAVTCFVVRAPFRRRGLSVPLLEGAVALARDGGADVVEGYPVDVTQRAKIAYPELYVGTLTTFLAAGFEEVARSAPARPIVRRAALGARPTAG